MAKIDPYEAITTRIIALLEQGKIPWVKPWESMGGNLPTNLVSKKPYRGVNTLILAWSGYSSPYWVTFRQAKKLKGYVRKGEKSTRILFWKIYEKEGADGDKSTRAVAREYSVFNLDQTEGINVPSTPEPKPFTPIEACEKVVAEWDKRPKICHGGDRAFYRPSADSVQMPCRESFKDPQHYYSTLFHELGHSTGHVKRLGRKGVTDPIMFGSHRYSKEELVAEMTAAFCAGHTGIEQATIQDSAAYISCWLSKLQDDQKLFVQAAGKAQHAADMILGVKHPKKDQSE